MNIFKNGDRIEIININTLYGNNLLRVIVGDTGVIIGTSSQINHAIVMLEEGCWFRQITININCLKRCRETV